MKVLFKDKVVISYLGSGGLLPSMWVIFLNPFLCKNDACSPWGSVDSGAV